MDHIAYFLAASYARGYWSGRILQKDRCERLIKRYADRCWHRWVAAAEMARSF